MLIKFQKCLDIIQSIHDCPINTVFHVGAHEGQEAESYAQFNVQKVAWFEANPNLIPKLEAHVFSFSLENQIIPYALWDKTTELEFNITNYDQSSSLFDLDKHLEYYPNIYVKEKIMINAFRLDSLIEVSPNFLKWHNFDFLNIDTQGAELAILRGIGKYLSSVSLKAIYLEVNSEKLYKNIPLVNEIDDFLANFDFYRCITAWTQAGWGDALYIKQNTFNN